MGWLLGLVRLSMAVDCADLSWRVINDTVMGGRSQAQVLCEERGAHYSGELSLENNGGFSSIRSPMPDYEGGLRAIRLRVVGDGRTYLATLRAGRSMIYHRMPFSTVDGEELLLELPLSSYRPYAYGRLLTDVPPIWVTGQPPLSIGFMLSDKQPGAFSLQILELSIVNGRPAVPSLSSEHRQQLLSAISKGVPLYNRGQSDQCAALYLSTLNRLQSQLDDEWLAESLLLPQQETRPDAQAWLARHIIDQLLSE